MTTIVFFPPRIVIQIGSHGHSFNGGKWKPRDHQGRLRVSEARATRVLRRRGDLRRGAARAGAGWALAGGLDAAAGRRGCPETAAWEPRSPSSGFPLNH